MSSYAGNTVTDAALLTQVGKLVSEISGQLTPDVWVQRLAQMLGLDCAFVAETDAPSGGQLRVVAGWHEGARRQGELFELDEILRLHVRHRNGWCYPSRSLDSSPITPTLWGLEPDGTAGVPLMNRQGEMIGLLACASRRPFTEPALIESVLQIVAPQAAAELEWRRSERKTPVAESCPSLLLEECQDAITLLSMTGERIYSSPIATTLLGYPAELYARQSTFDTVHPDDVVEARKLFRDLVRQPGRRVSLEIRCRHFDGSWRWIHTTSVNLLEQPEVGAIVCTWRDVTRRREAEAALRESEARFRGLVSNIPGAVYRCECQPGGRLQYLSEGIEAITGYPAADYLEHAQRSFLELIHPDDQEWVIAEVLRSASSGVPFVLEYRTVHRSGEIRWIRSRGRVECAEDGTPLWVDGVMFDETEQRRRDQQLAEQRLALIHAVEGIGRLDLNGRYLEVNPAYAELLGRTAEELVGQSWQITVHPEEIPKVQEAFSQMLRDGKVEIDVRGLRADGTTFYKQVAVVLTRDENGTPSGYFCFAKDVTARLEMEAAVRCSEARFRALVEGASDVVGVIDAQGVIRYESPAIEKIMGYSPAELEGVYAFELIHPEDIPHTQTLFAELLANPGLHRELCYRVRHRNGDWRLLEGTATSLLDQPGVHGVVVNARDVTERQATEERARFQAAVLEALKEATEEGVLLVSPAGDVLTCNRRFQELWRLPDAVARARREEGLLEVALPQLEDPEEFVRRVQRLMATQETSYDEIRFRDGRVLERYGAPVRGEDGVLYGRVWRFRNITEQKRAQRKDLAFQRLGHALNTTATPEAAARVMLRVADELLGWDACWLDLFSDDPRAKTALVFQDIIDGKRTDVPVPLGRRSPSPMAVRAIEEGPLLILHDPNALPPPDADGFVPFGDQQRTSASILCVPIRSGERVIGAVSIQSYTFFAYDEAALNTFQALADYCGGALERTIAEAARHDLEQQLIQAQKMEAVGRLAGGVAHDFNNMLAVISGYSELLLMNAPPGHSMNGPLEQIRKAGERAARLTQQLLAFSRKQILQPQVLNLNDVVLGIDRMLRRLIGEDIELVTLNDPAVRRIKADPGQIEQVLLNLAVNARDAMPQGGKLTIQTRNLHVDEEFANRVPDARPGPYVLLSVSDTGSGMDAETLERIFEPFFTTKEVGKGTGLGLATVYGIVSQSDGFVQVQSTPNQGTTFCIHFPAVDRPSPLLGTPDEDLPQGSPSRETVLVVEDEPMVRDLIRRVLETCGYEVLEALQGEEALRIADAHHGPIHLLLTDVVMPRMGGRELAERFRVQRPDAKILLMSGYTDDAGLRHGLAGLEASFLQKPFSPHILARTVGELLRL